MTRLQLRLWLSALLLAVALGGLSSCSDTDDDEAQEQPGNSNNLNANDTSTEPSLARLEFPRVKGGSSRVLIHTTGDQYGINYSVEWDVEKKAQRWSAYQMSAETSVSRTSRYYGDPQYPYDPLLPQSEYLSQDLIYGSGYEHGHICPSADRLYSVEANYQTFFLTNMQPQDHMMNSGGNYDSPWYRLEGQVRSWAKAASTKMLYVVKGGTIEDDQLRAMVKGELRVPKYFFVALLLQNAEGYKAVGFWLEHDGRDHGKEPLSSYAVNIRTLEELTGIDFFCNLPDDVEDHVESLPLENVKRAWGL